MTDKKISDLLTKTADAHKRLVAGVLNDIPAAQVHRFVKAIIATALATGLLVERDEQ